MSDFRDGGAERPLVPAVPHLSVQLQEDEQTVRRMHHLGDDGYYKQDMIWPSSSTSDMMRFVPLHTDCTADQYYLSCLWDDLDMI